MPESKIFSMSLVRLQAATIASAPPGTATFFNLLFGLWASLAVYVLIFLSVTLLLHSYPIYNVHSKKHFEISKRFAH